MDIWKMAVATLCCSMVSVSWAGTAQPGKRPSSYPLPPSKKECATCHVTEGTKVTAALKKELSGLCLDCHPDRTAPREHRIDIEPSQEVKKLPLTNGKMTCVTCHDPHKNLYGALRRLPGTELCLACHPK
jgi:predicted CXXCH cytochrome family protein